MLVLIWKHSFDKELHKLPIVLRCHLTLLSLAQSLPLFAWRHTCKYTEPSLACVFLGLVKAQSHWTLSCKQCWSFMWKLSHSQCTVLSFICLVEISHRLTVTGIRGKILKNYENLSILFYFDSVGAVTVNSPIVNWAFLFLVGAQWQSHWSA